MNLKLPDIEPAQPVPYTQAIDRAGAAFQDAANKTADVLLQMDKADLVVQTQEAALQTTKGLNDTLNTIKNGPYVSPDRVKAMFGGKVPEGVALDEDVAGPGGELVKQPRRVIPMHEVAPYLFDRASSAVAENAARGIKEAPWRAKFKQAQAVEVERARAEMMDWQRGQRLADYHVRTLAQLSQAAAQRNWALYEVILNTSENHLGVPEREKLRAMLPSMKTEANVLDRLRGSQTIEEIDALISDIQTNNAKTKENSDAPFDVSLSAQEQLQHASAAKARRNEMLNAMAAAERERKEAAFQTAGDLVEAELDARAQGGTTGLSIAHINKGSMDFDKSQTLRHALEAPSKRTTDFGLYAEMSKMVQEDPQRFARLNLWRHYERLDDPEFKEVLGWQRAIANKEEGRETKPPVPGFLRDEIERVVASVFEVDPKTGPKNAREYNEAVGRLIKVVAPAYRKDPDRDWTYNDVAVYGARLFTDSKKTKNAARPITAAGLSAAGKPVTDSALAAADEQMEADAPLVEEAFARYWEDDDPSDAVHALVHARLINPVDLNVTKTKLAAQKMNPEDRRNQINRIVQDLTPEERARYAQAAALEETKARARDELNVEQAKRKAETEVKWRAMPEWERAAEQMREAELRDLRESVERNAFGRARAETSAAHGASPSWLFPEAKEQARAEVERILPGREEDLRAEFEAAKAAYRTFMEAKNAGDPLAVHLYEKFHLWSFWSYMARRRENEVN